MHANAKSWDLKTRIKNGVERYTFVFNNLNRGGRNKRNDPPTLVADPSVRQKGSK